MTLKLCEHGSPPTHESGPWARGVTSEMAGSESGPRAICQRVILIDRGRKALDQPLSELTGGGTSLEEVFARVMSRDTTIEPEEDAA